MQSKRIIDAKKSQHSDASFDRRSPASFLLEKLRRKIIFIDDERTKHRQLNDPINILNFRISRL